MGRVASQFYALREELFPLVKHWKEQFGFRMLVVQYFPELTAFEVDGFEDVKINHDDIDEIRLGYGEPTLDEKDRYKFMLRHSNFLTIQLGKLSRDGLQESAILGQTDDPELLATWKKITRQLAKVTMAGLWAVNTERGGKHFYRNARYSSGAEELSKSGVKLVTDGSFVYCSVDEPETE